MVLAEQGPLSEHQHVTLCVMRMQSGSASFDLDAYWQAGSVPWTVFAYPASLVDADGLPLDDEAKRYLQELRSRGCRVNVWQHPEIQGTIYFACPYEDRDTVHAEIEGLERQGVFPVDFASTRCEALFALASGNT